MKIRWRQHEILFVTVLVVRKISLIIFGVAGGNHAQAPILEQKFTTIGRSFSYWENFIFPQINAVLIFYAAYLSVNLLILPFIKRITFTDFEKILSRNSFQAAFFILLTSFLLAMGVNTISWYAMPHLTNYANYQLLASMGYNDQPLTNAFTGLDRALALVTVITLIASLRELIIWLISKPGPKKEYRFLIANNITALSFIYLLIPVFMNPIHETFKQYVAFVTPVILLYIYLTFWLFPFKGEKSFKHPQVLSRLFLTTIAGAIPVAFVLWDDQKFVAFLLYWSFLAGIITPFSWLLYRERKEKILQLRGMETALANSNANLQFLRAQINPHFLFNALNTLYGTAIKENAENSAVGIQKLGDMMRFMLDENHLDQIPMQKETEYLRNYIALQKLRTHSSPDILIEDNIDEFHGNNPIAPMLLIPLVENAFKYGISLNQKSWININLESTGETIRFEVRNSIHKRDESIQEVSSPGIGLKNLKERLKLLYPEKHKIDIIQTGTEFTASLILNQ